MVFYVVFAVKCTPASTLVGGYQGEAGRIVHRVRGGGGGHSWCVERSRWEACTIIVVANVVFKIAVGFKEPNIREEVRLSGTRACSPTAMSSSRTELLWLRSHCKPEIVVKLVSQHEKSLTRSKTVRLLILCVNHFASADR
jgi:hypothetical protein